LILITTLWFDNKNKKNEIKTPVSILTSTSVNESWVGYIKYTYSYFVGGLMFYLCYFCLLVYSGIKHVLTIWVTWRVSYKRQKLLTLREQLGSTPVFGGVRVAHHFNLLCGFLFFLLCLSSSCVLCAHCCQCLWNVHFWLPLRFSLTFI
jgi:hypothetical protein